MLLNLLMAIGSGVASGVLFVLPAKGMMLGVWLSILAPLPLMIAMLGYGGAAGLLAGLVGAVLTTFLQPALGFVFVISAAVPSLLLGWLARRTSAAGKRVSPGFLLAVASGLAIAGVAFMVGVVRVTYGSLDTAVSEITTGLEQVLKTMNGVENATPGLTSAEFAQMLVVSAPAIMAFWSVIALSMNLWLAGRVVLQPRPSPARRRACGALAPRRSLRRWASPSPCKVLQRCIASPVAVAPAPACCVRCTS